jgi:hypothetical protein
VRLTFLCLLLCLLHGVSGPAAAQSRELPDWVVPVLRLVSSTHVEPTTGVVLSNDGLVLVAADFAAPGDEIIVLDGGTDIIRNGRPARLERGFPDLGLEVLQVDGLRRTAAPVAPADPADGSSLKLRAFPPAEQIAEGAPPLSSETTANVFPESETPALSADKPLPNVTGPLLDECGNLAAFSLAEGVQTLTPSAGTAYRWRPALHAVLLELQLPVTGIPCGAGATGAVEPSTTETDEPAQQPVPEQPAAPEAAAAATPAGEDLPEEEQEPGIAEAEPTIELLPPFEVDVADGSEATEPVVADAPPAPWPWLLGGLALLAAGGGFYLLRRRDRAALSVQASTARADRPDLAERALEEVPGGGPTPADCRLVLQGRLADGRPFEAATAVSEHAINVEIGRGGAELVIDSPSVSRRHARLNGTRAALTLTDLGSSNGSSINGVPCLEGEIMYLEEGDQVMLGDARFTIAIEDVHSRGGAK